MQWSVQRKLWFTKLSQELAMHTETLTRMMSTLLPLLHPCQRLQARWCQAWHRWAGSVHFTWRMLVNKLAGVSVAVMLNSLWTDQGLCFENIHRWGLTSSDGNWKHFSLVLSDCDDWKYIYLLIYQISCLWTASSTHVISDICNHCTRRLTVHELQLPQTVIASYTGWQCIN